MDRQYGGARDQKERFSRGDAAVRRV